MIVATEVCKDYHSETRHRYNRVLSDVSFSIEPGQKVAIMGRNGAGKSTLVRLLAGIELPTLGKIEWNMSVSWPIGFIGGVGGTMTGNDNIRMIARLYGRKFKELRDVVEDFAQLGAFLSEPVRTYSTGMRGRLNFALSLAIDFDCYLVDEVLGVGDQRFQHRCHDELFVRRADKSLILVSHHPETLKAYCSRALVLHRGRAKMFDDVDLAIAVYSEL